MQLADRIFIIGFFDRDSSVNLYGTPGLSGSFLVIQEKLHPKMQFTDDLNTEASVLGLPVP